jgi:cation diffusion facilitator family transporter
MVAETRAGLTLPREESLGRRLASISIVVGVLLASAKVYVGVHAHSDAVLSDGLESAGDILSAAIVYAGFWIASKPPDAEHPYGHGRYETLSGLAVGAMLLLAGAGILWHGATAPEHNNPLPFYTLYPLFASILLKLGLAAAKFRISQKIASTSLRADAWHDVTDLASTTVALFAVTLTLLSPERFAGADRIGSILIGVLILFLSVRVVRQTMDQLVDTMPEPEKMAQIRRSALGVRGALGIEKCFARRTGLRYHVDLHLEVDPDMTVRESHHIATEVRFAIKRDLPWVADVLVHVEPSPLVSKALPTRAQRERIHGE